MHGKDWSKIFPLIPTRNPNMIRSMARCLEIKLEKEPDHPDADILSILKEKTKTRGDWTEDDQLTLKHGLCEHGNDLKKLVQLFPNKNIL